MDLNYSTGHWEGSPCFPSLAQALPSSEPAATAQMGEEWGPAAAWLVFDTVHQGGVVTALESCSFLLWAAVGQGHPLKQQFQSFKLFICQGVLFKSTSLMCITAAKGNFLKELGEKGRWEKRMHFPPALSQEWKAGR